MATTVDGKNEGEPRLRRAQTLWDLIIRGIILSRPTAPMPVFGVVSQEARGREESRQHLDPESGAEPPGK